MANVPKPKENDYLTAKCHCGGVELKIRRANFSSEMEKGEEKHKPRHIPSDPTKYLASMCACRSCRLATGTSLVPWMLIPVGNVFTSPSSQKSDLAPLILGKEASNPSANSNQRLKHYWSSQDACWSHCGKCGAAMYYWNEKRKEEVDILVGVLRAEEGAMARRWLEWKWGSVGFEEEVVDAEVIEAWRVGVEVMRIENE